MNQNLHLIKYDLMQWDFKEHITQPPYELSCEYPMICAGHLPKELSSNILYLCNSSSLPADTGELPRISFISIGRPADGWFDSAHNFLYIEENCPDLSELMNQICSQFHRYDEWEKSLQEVIDKDLPVKEFARRSFSYVNNPIYVQGDAFKVLISYLPALSDKSDLYINYKEKFSAIPNSTLSTEEINSLISDSEYNQAVSEIEPTIYSGTLYGFRTLFYNIRINQYFIARICFDEILHDFSGKDFALIKVLGDYIGKALNRNNCYAFNRPVELDEILQNLLSHTLLPERRIISVLNYYQWNIDDTYICLLLKINTTDDTHSALFPLALMIAALLKNDCYTIYNNRIVFICNLTKANKNKKQLLAEITPILRDNLLTASTSAPYHDFKNLYYYYLETLFTEKAGNKKDPTRWYYHFENYKLDYILYKCLQKNISETFIPEGFFRLQEYDRVKGTDYVNTLQVYIENERNIAKTTRLTYMHRNTFLYRINKIQEILQMDLDDPKERFVLQLVFLFNEFMPFLP